MNPPPAVSHRSLFRLRTAIVVLWTVVIGVGVYLFIFHREQTQAELARAMSVSWWAAGGLYLLLSILRGLILMPAAPLVILGVAFLPPVPLFILTLTGTLISSSLIYWFPSDLGFEAFFRGRHKEAVARLRQLLVRREMPVIIGWSFLPFTPTVMIVYVCGLLRIDFKKAMSGVLVGSGANNALYIFLGDYLLRLTGLKL